MRCVLKAPPFDSRTPATIVGREIGGLHFMHFVILVRKNKVDFSGFGRWANKDKVFGRYSEGSNRTVCLDIILVI